MATATVSGSLSDFQLDPIAGLYPEIEFRPSSAAVGTGSRLMVSKPVKVKPTSGGSFSVNLQTTDDLLPSDMHYKISIRWLDAGDNFIKADNPNWKLRVPLGGGAIADLIRFPIGPGLVITSPTAPALWVGLAAMWLQMDPNDPNNPTNPANTGDLYEVRDV